MKTVLTSFYFDISDSDQAEAFRKLKAELLATPGRGQLMESHGGGSHYLGFARNGIEVELEPNFLFSNQWNTAPIGGISDSGLRVFDFALDYIPSHMNKSIKRGHYLEITQEMRDIRDNTNKCGYCGAMEPAQKGYVFCPHCLGSEYLEAKDLPLLRMLPVSTDYQVSRAPLTDAERDWLLPQYKEAQLHGRTERDKKRIADKRARIESDFEKTIRNAKAKHDGLLWLMDNGVNVNNVIYYDHTGRFCFGWRKPVDDSLYSELVDILCEFPFDYDIKRA